MGSTAKRRRKNGADNVVADTHNATPLITRLPFELIAEILLYSKSPAELLSLSRTCKHFHATLVQNPAAVFIWKDVRAQTTPPIPSPIKFGFSEPQLANFIYGGGKCTVSSLLPRFTLLALTLRPRNVVSAQAICTHRFLHRFASVGIRSVAADICQSTTSAVVPQNSRTTKGQPCSLLRHPPTCNVVTLDRMVGHHPR